MKCNLCNKKVNECETCREKLDKYLFICMQGHHFCCHEEAQTWALLQHSKWNFAHSKKLDEDDKKEKGTISNKSIIEITQREYADDRDISGGLE